MVKKILVKSRQNEIVKPGVMKTIKELGCPFFGSPFRHGHLYIDFEIIFPEKLDEKETKLISEILKDERLNKNDSMSDSKEDVYFLSDYKIEDENTNYKGGKRKETGEEDEEGGEDDENRHGHRTMNCAHQ